MASRLIITVSCGSFTLSSSKSTVRSALSLPASKDKDFVGDMVYSSLLSVDAAGSTRMFTLVFTASGGDTSMMIEEDPFL